MDFNKKDLLLIIYALLLLLLPFFSNEIFVVLPSILFMVLSSFQWGKKGIMIGSSWSLFLLALTPVVSPFQIALYRIGVASILLFGSAIGLAYTLDAFRGNQKQILATKKKYEELIQQTSDWVWEVDTKGVYTFVNHKAQEILGYKTQEIIGETPFAFVAEEEKESLEQLFKDSVAQKKPLHLIQATLIHKKGGKVFLETSGLPFFDEKGSLMGYRGIGRDITLRKREEEKMKMNHKRLITILNSIDALVFVADLLSYELLFVNDYGLKEWGPIIGKKCWKIFHEDQKIPCSQCSHEMLIDEGGKPTGVYRWVTKNPTNNRWFDCRDQAIPWIDGRLVRLQIATDITYHKEMEEDLRIKEKAIETSINAIALANMEGELTYVNPSFLKMWGYHQSNEVIGRSALEFWQEEEKAKKIVIALLEQENWTGELVAKKKDGQLFYVHLSASLVYDQNKEPFQMMASFIDITENKLVQESLRESQEHYQELADSITDIFFAFDKELNYTYWNKASERLTGIPAEEAMGKNIYHLFHRTPQTKRAEKIYQQVLKTGQFHSFEHTYDFGNKRNDFEINAYPTKKGIAVFVKDITQRKLAEKKIEKYTKEIELRNFQLEKLYKYLDREIEKALKIHYRNLPHSFPEIDHLTFGSFYQPAEKMGGDFYNTQKKGIKLISYISDVTGHGLESALLSSFVKDMITSYVTFTPEEEITAGKIVRFLFAQYKKNNFPEDFCICVFITVLQLEKLELEYLGAGIHDQQLLSIGDKILLELNHSGLPLSSTFNEKILNLKEKKILLKPPFTLLLNTDGITEQSVEDKPYKGRLKEVFKENSHLKPDDLIKAIKDDFRSFNRGSLQGDDDITLLVLQMEKK